MKHTEWIIQPNGSFKKQTQQKYKKQRKKWEASQSGFKTIHNLFTGTILLAPNKEHEKEIQHLKDTYIVAVEMIQIKQSQRRSTTQRIPYKIFKIIK